MATITEPTELISIDATIDSIAREALEEARRTEEAAKYRKNPGPLVAPEAPLGTLNSVDSAS